MAFGFKATWSHGNSEMNSVGYQWSTKPSDDQIEEIVKEAKVFRYERTLIKVIKYLRDEVLINSCICEGGLVVEKRI